MKSIQSTIINRKISIRFKLQLTSLHILNSKYKIIFTLSLFLILHFFYSSGEFIAFCSTEEQDEYINFLEEGCWKLDSRICELEKKVRELEHIVEDLKQTVQEQKALIEAQQTILAQTGG